MILQFANLTDEELAANASPFLKWVGGKTQLLKQLDRWLPQSCDHYIEPFIGGGAVFFYLRSAGRLRGKVTLADINPELINAYRVVQKDVASLIILLEKHQQAHCKDYFYFVRNQKFTENCAGAARTVYLNKTAFNGLYRVNSKGGFNVPIGDYKNPTIADELGLRRASFALQGVSLKVQGYEQTLAEAAANTFAYLDPPYIPISPTSSFTDYAPGGFGLEDQRHLAECVRRLHSIGAKFTLSNSSNPLVCELYRGFDILEVSAKRAINSKAERRNAIAEFVVTNSIMHKEIGHNHGRKKSGSRKRSGISQ
jgi:DNA adenine methylase